MLHHSSIRIVLLTGLFFITACVNNTHGPFELERASDGLLLKEKTQPVLFYRTKSISSKQYPSRNNYIHPLYAISGDTLTEDYPDDHMHHRGIFWAWHHIWLGNKRMGDPWICKDFMYDIREISSQLGSKSAELNINTLWKSSMWKDREGIPLPLAEEKMKLVIFPETEGTRTLLFDISITSLNDSLKIGGSRDEKGYGGFSWRVKLPDQVVFSGTDGIVQPMKKAVQAGPWIHMFDGQADTDDHQGLMVISHPENPGEGGRWILRDQASMQNAVFPGSTPIVLNEGEHFRLRYGLIIYEGNPVHFSPEKHYRKYLTSLQEM